MNHMETTIIGGGRVKAILAKFSEGLGEHVPEGLEAAADKVASDAKALCPVDTGSLQKSIRTESVSSAGGEWSVGVTAGGYVINPKSKREVDYAACVEYGTSRMMAQPFLKPALIQNQAAIRDAISLAVMDTIESAVFSVGG